MSVEMTPITGADPIEGSYLTVAEARELGAALPLPGALLAKSDADLGVLLFAASLDIDSAMPYQGVRYEADQVRQFPRYQRALGSLDVRLPRETLAGWIGVWDWDADANEGSGAAVVPQQVRIATLYQAASLLDASFRARLEAIRSGLASQSVGSLSESYVKAADLPGGTSGAGGGLCATAQRLMSYYRLRSAPLL